MRKVRIPIEGVRWTKCGVAWTCEHITLGEGDSACWAAEDRLRRRGMTVGVLCMVWTQRLAQGLSQKVDPVPIS